MIPFLRINTFRYLILIPISGIDTSLDTFGYPQIIWKLYRRFLHGKFLFFLSKSIKIGQWSLKMNFQTSNQIFERRKMRYRKLIWVLILLDTLFRYLFQVSILFYTLSRYPYGNLYFLIPHRHTDFRFRYLGIDTCIDTRYRYKRYLT